MINEELVELKELCLKVKPFEVLSDMPEEDRMVLAKTNSEFFVLAHSTLPDLIDELLTCRQGGSFGSDLSNFNL